MRVILLALVLVLTINTNVRPDDFSPLLRMSTISTEESALYSGVVFNEDNDKFYVLTCEHALMNMKTNVRTFALAYSINEESPTEYVSLKCKLLKRDSKNDLCLYEFKKPYYLKISPIPLAKSSLVVGTTGEICGYSNENLMRSTAVVMDNGDLTGLLVTKANVISGMSGGPFVQNDMVFGIQSCGKTNNYLANLKIIQEFIK